MNGKPPRKSAVGGIAMSKETTCGANVAAPHATGTTLEQAKALIVRHAPLPGVHRTAVPGLTLYRITSNAFIERSAGELMTSFIVEGRKSTAIGGKVLEYGAGESLVCGISSPSEFHTLDATPENPFLALSVSLDMTVLMEYAGSLAWRQAVRKGGEMPNGVHVIRPDEDLAEAFVALLKLLERPALIPLRAPLLLRDLHVLLLDSSCGPSLRSLACAGTEGHAVLNAVSWIRTNYADSSSIETLAARANMSNATFHRHFRKVTGFSPLQFRKRVRLFEARRMLLAREANVTTASYRVGYESSAQFVRDYKSLFGDSPLRDIKRLRESGAQT